VGQLFEVAGVVALVVGAVVACGMYVSTVVRQPDKRTYAYRELCKVLGRAILIGLECDGPLCQDPVGEIRAGVRN